MNPQLEFWAALAGGFIYVIQRARSDPWYSRITKAIVAALFALAFARDLSSYVRDNEALAAILIMLLGEVVLDIFTAIASDRQFWSETIKEVIRKRLGVGSNDDKK